MTKSIFTILKVEKKEFENEQGKKICYFPITVLSESGDILKAQANEKIYDLFKSAEAGEKKEEFFIELCSGTARSAKQEIVKLKILDVA